MLKSHERDSPGVLIAAIQAYDLVGITFEAKDKQYVGANKMNERH